MAEHLVLTTPTTPTNPTISDYAIWSLYLGRGEGVIKIVVQDNNFERHTFRYADDPLTQSTIATDMMIALNKANLSVKSLHRRVLERLIADGHLVGSVTGDPE